MNLEDNRVGTNSENTNTNFTPIKSGRKKFLLLVFVTGLTFLIVTIGLIYWINARSKSSTLSISPSLKNLEAQSNIPCSSTALKPAQKVCADLLHKLRTQTKEQIALYQITIIEVVSQRFDPCLHLAPNMGMCAPGDHSVPGFQITLSYLDQKYIYDTDRESSIFYHLDNPNPTPAYVQLQKTSDVGSMTLNTNSNQYDWVNLYKYNLQFRVPHSAFYGTITTKYFGDSTGQYSEYYLTSTSFMNKTSTCLTEDKFKGAFASVVPADSENSARTSGGSGEEFNAIGWAKIGNQYYHIESTGRCYKDPMLRKLADTITDEFTKTARSIH